ncbi:MAG: hypothetical protein AB2A00_37735 [Myxococcota bacterium]
MAAHLSVWEVQDVAPGQWLDLKDLFTGETRRVHEVRGSRVATRRMCLLTRVADWAGISLLAGVHPNPLPPEPGAGVVAEIRTCLGAKKKPVPLSKLRDPETALDLLTLWGNVVAALDRRPPPTMVNMDGDPLLFTADHFRIAPGEHDALLRDLERIPGVEQGDEGNLVFTRKPKAKGAGLDNVIVGHARVEKDELILESNSVQRADWLRETVEGRAGTRVTFRARTHQDPMSSNGERKKRAPPQPPPPELRAAILQLRAEHYRKWPDVPLPALKGKTPREAVKQRGGREKVEQLLKEMESIEAGMPEGDRFDFAVIRRELGFF